MKWSINGWSTKGIMNDWIGGAAGVVVVAAGGDWVINRVFPAVIVEGSRNRRM